MSTLITPKLIQCLRQTFGLRWDGIHGAAHWARVRRNGLELAPHTGANPRVVEYFAFLHDICRHDDGDDPEHGRRAAEFARTLLGTLIDLETHEFEELSTACELHTRGLIWGYSPTILTCWDADRLDLERVGVPPFRELLCTEAAKRPDMIQRARWRSTNKLYKFEKDAGRLDRLRILQM
jgi:uncharacterized protein